MKITAPDAIATRLNQPPGKTTSSPPVPGFVESLKESIGKVNDLQTTAGQAMTALAAGESENIHETIIAIEQAEISFKLMTQVRNKIISAYQEIMRMSV